MLWSTVGDSLPTFDRAAALRRTRRLFLPDADCVTSMTTHRIELPTAVAMHQIRNVLNRADFFPPNPARITLSFHPQKNHFDPMGIAMLASWASYWRSRNVPIDLANTNHPSLGYAARMGLFEALGVDYPRPIEEHESTGRFVELTEISAQDDLSRMCADVGGLLRVPNLIEFVQYVMAELIRNVLEHAYSSAFVCAQHYPNDKRVTIAVADCGCGIQYSLSRNYGFSDARAAILAALRPGISGTTSTPYSSSDNAGLGLFYARGVAKASKRSFVLCSGNALYKQHKPNDTGSVPLPDPTEEKHDVIVVRRPWQGTVVGVNIRAFDGDLQRFMSRIGPILNTGAMMRRTPNIRFT